MTHLQLGKFSKEFKKFSILQLLVSSDELCPLPILHFMPPGYISLGMKRILLILMEFVVKTRSIAPARYDMIWE